jgi:hypothetical protein
MTRHFAFGLLLALAAVTACSDESTSVGGGSGAGAGGSGGGSGSGSGGGGSGGGTAGAPAGGTGGGSGAGTSGGGSGEGGSSSEFECLNQGETNFDCPFNLPPISGTCAPAGDCCHRSSNIAKIETLGPDDPAEIEFRLNYVDVYNHPQSIGLPDLVRIAGQRADVCSGEQCLLWRFTAPRKDGEFVPGAAEVEIGIGAYNCDGTYSFYGPNAAPDRSDIIGESDPGRWQSVKVPAEFDPAETGRDRFHIPWETNENRKIARSIFLLPTDNSIDWELASSGFDITEIDWSDDVLDCIGSRNGLIGWNAVSGFVAYSPMEGNETDISNQINQTYCSLLAFGLLPEGMKNKDCLTTERCLPDGGSFSDGGCDWIKLPDSLCPETDDQRALWGCHLGAEGNPNEEDGYPDTLNCTADAPTVAQNPDMGVTTTGQCCDALGQSTSLPACNAYRTVGKFVAASAEITDDPRDDLPPVCH